MITIVKAFPNNRPRRSPFISFTLGKALVFDERIRFSSKSGFVEAEIFEERGDANGGVFVGRVLRVLDSPIDHPIHLPPSFYTTENCNGILVVKPNAESPTGYVLPANVKVSLLKPADVYAVIVQHGREDGGVWQPTQG